MGVPPSSQKRGLDREQAPIYCRRPRLAVTLPRSPRPLQRATPAAFQAASGHRKRSLAPHTPSTILSSGASRRSDGGGPGLSHPSVHPTAPEEIRKSPVHGKYRKHDGRQQCGSQPRDYPPRHPRPLLPVRDVVPTFRALLRRRVNLPATTRAGDRLIIAAIAGKLPGLFLIKAVLNRASAHALDAKPKKGFSCDPPATRAIITI